MLRNRVRAILLTGVIGVLVIWAIPARSQFEPPEPDPPAETEVKTEKVELAPEGDAKAAVTAKEPDIPVDELQLLVKPLSLEELLNEAAAWQLLLKGKVEEISNAEVAVKRQNRSIAKQQEVAGSLDEAKKALEESDKALKSAVPGSPEYQEAAKKAEEAKEKLKKAQEGIKEASQAKTELKQDDTLNEALKKAEKTGELELAQTTLDEAKKEREKIDASSPAYNAATQKIDALDKAIKAVEEAEKNQKGFAPDSPEYKQGTQKIEEAHIQLKKAREAITGNTSSSNGGTGAAEKSADKLDEAAATIENTNIKANGETLTANSSPGPGSGQGNVEKKGQQLQKTSDKLQENAQNEAELKNKLLVNATNLQSGRTAIVDRFNVILEELDRKGGDSKYYRKYIEAITKAEIDVTDTQGLGVRVISWLKSDEGGLRWAGNLGKFVGIVLASAIVFQILGVIVSKLLKLSNTSKLMRQFIVVIIKRGGIFVGVLLALTALEVSLAPVLAVLGGASFIFAFALQSNLGNFASGLMLMLYKPFDVGDEVELAGVFGTVDSISLASTRLKTLTADLVTIPNNTVWEDKIINYSHDQYRRIQLTIRSDYSNNISQVRKVLVEVAKDHPSILENPAPPTTGEIEFEEYYVQINLWVWTKTAEFWKTKSELFSMIQERFEKEGYSIATPP
ncbi:mechanosensitive ion channel domain-containing protein [Kamptonema sp. UHCC 0994]|uniref:mechanosensitive ion channel domain-containing protein n=1 Tax=Kamptonema sp. UHCC 0994 TaxID=3031329 RepID=UPI0023BA357A|nr:mechanosensitive ion channel domain-containing protein [Kamptonema sp. UHCC 0994]MDF0553585.1 mechanosensitive ion channel [Kamptonema sp. UHCC 0994]